MPILSLFSYFIKNHSRWCWEFQYGIFIGSRLWRWNWWRQYCNWTAGVIKLLFIYNLFSNVRLQAWTYTVVIIYKFQSSCMFRLDLQVRHVHDVGPQPIKALSPWIVMVIGMTMLSSASPILKGCYIQSLFLPVCHFINKFPVWHGSKFLAISHK